MGNAKAQEQPISRMQRRLQTERRELSEILEDTEDIIARVPQHGMCKRHVIDMWTGGTGQSERQFRRRLDDMREDLRRVYDRLPDGPSRKSG